MTVSSMNSESQREVDVGGGSAACLNEAFLSPLVSGDNPYRVDAPKISQRASLLQKYLCDEQKELQALYALQALMVHMEQPASECPCSEWACRMPACHVSWSKCFSVQWPRNKD